MMRRPLSLAVRLTLSIGAVITAVLLMFGWVIERSINNHFIQQDLDELNAVVQALRHALETRPAGLSADALGERLGSAVSGHHNARYRVSMGDGSVVYATPGSDLGRLVGLVTPVEEITVDSVEIWQDAGENFRGAMLRVAPAGPAGMGEFTITVATGIDFHLHYLESFHHYLRLVTLVACLVGILATWFAVHQGHAPIRRISEEMRSIKSDQLHIRLDGAAVPAELVELAASFNQMLDRLEAVFRRLSEFSADIAHELRTPITNLMTQTEVALSQPRTIEQYREILYSDLEEYERMAKMVGDMLFLAQADNHLLKPELVRVDLESEIRILFDYFGAWAEEREVELKVVGEPLLIAGDRLMIRRALSNLISNAIRYTHAGGSVTAVLGLESDQARIRIQNPGRSIPAEHLPHIFERFYRPDASRRRAGEGAGLGLAITRSIVEAHGGSISARSSAQLTEFEVSLPMLKG